MEFFDKEVGFSWRAYKNLGNRYTCDDFMIGPFMAIVGMTTLLVAYDKRSIIYLVATNAG